MLTTEEKIQIVKWYYGNNSMDSIANNLFVLVFDRAINKSSVANVINMFEKKMVVFSTTVNQIRKDVKTKMKMMKMSNEQSPCFH